MAVLMALQYADTAKPSACTGWHRNRRGEPNRLSGVPCRRRARVPSIGGGDVGISFLNEAGAIASNGHLGIDISLPGIDRKITPMTPRKLKALA